MVVLVVAMLVCVALGAVVVGFVAVEARRAGREVFTPEGEQILADVRKRGDDLRERGEHLRRRTTGSGSDR
jgi:hypothetical protein